MKKIIAIFIVVFSVVMFVLLMLEFYVIFPINYTSAIKKHSLNYGLNPALVASIICTESKFNAGAKSAKGAAGLMQLMPSTFNWVADELGEDVNSTNIFDAETNIKYGCFYLNYLFKKYQNEIFVLACYNAGEGVVCSWGSADNFSIELIRYAETRAYVNKVESLKRFYASRIE
ncbi:MAG: lytic transglycosylase domain-containing protein [Clostridia bacterium]|nr:lytic transglycosylase domain-containing protein [Clostridia bacterium]